MKVVRIATSGTIPRIFRIIARYEAGSPPRRIRDRTDRDTCCRGMSTYGRNRGFAAIR